MRSTVAIVFRALLGAAAVAFVVAVLVIALGGCGEPKLDHGTVVSKVHEPAHDYVIFIPIQTSSICSGSGTTRICTPIYSQFPYFVHDGEDWKLELHDGDKNGWDYVDRETWERTPIGAKISKGRTTDPTFSKRRQ